MFFARIIEPRSFQEYTVTAKTSATGGTRQREVRTVIENRQARHLFSIEDTFEAGLILEGWEVKAILSGRANFNGGSAFIRMTDGEAFLDGLTVTPMPQAVMGGFIAMEALRKRKLLLHKTELNKLQRRVSERGYTVVPLALTYNGKLKVQIGLAKGKNLHDKRDTLKQRDIGRDMARDLRAA
jgi:SsrA-binding protein